MINVDIRRMLEGQWCFKLVEYKQGRQAPIGLVRIPVFRVLFVLDAVEAKTDSPMVSLTEAFNESTIRFIESIENIQLCTEERVAEMVARRMNA
jgi:hypothetical protein